MLREHGFEQTATIAPSLDSATCGRVLRGWKDISSHLDVSVRTVQRWEREFGLPIRRICPGHGQPVHALVDELDAWRASAEAATHMRNEPADRSAGEATHPAVMTALSSTMKAIAAGLIGWIGK